MNARERFNAILEFKKPEERLPLIEWAAWWDKTMNRWKGEGLPQMGFEESQSHFGLDPMCLVNIWTRDAGMPKPAYHGAPLITDEASYDAVRSHLFTDELIKTACDQARKLKERHDRGEIVIRLWLDGFFWFPRAMFGIEPHFFAFYDHPELMHRMNRELSEFNIRAMREVFKIMKPDMVGFAEDMSYNHGPMLSRELYNEFLLPYYRMVIPFIKEQGVPVLVDSDGDITTMVPWLQDAGIEGVYPLERQAGVDVAKLRAAYPKFIMLGGYDKMTLMKGEGAIRAEFERLLPVMKSGGFVPSMDHQTPPECSLETYQIYTRLFREYAEKAVC